MNKLLLLAFLFLLFSCQKQKQHAFYYWKTSGKLKSTEKSILKDADIVKIYLKMFDVVWNENFQMPVNTLPVQNIDIQMIERKIVPVVFIRNEVFLLASDSQLIDLPVKVNNLIHSVLGKSIRFDEIQMDCDWTQKTKQAYFTFLKELKRLSNKQISVTLRLHQLKYQNLTGVPPADRATLMFYNMGDLALLWENNSILNLSKAENYLKGSSQYPLRLDFALPVYSWSVLIRNNKVKALFSDILETELKDTSKFVAMKNNYYFAKSSFLLHGKYFFRADIIRYEKTDTKLLNKATRLLKKYLSDEERDIILFQLDSAQIINFGYENISAVFADFN